MYFGRVYTPQMAKKKVTASMAGGQEGYANMRQRAHTVNHFAGKAPLLSSHSSHKLMSLPQQDLPSSDPRYETVHDIQKKMHAKQLASGLTMNKKGKAVNPNRANAQRGVHHHCKTCGSRRGKAYLHPVGGQCQFGKDEFKDNTEALFQG